MNSKKNKIKIVLYEPRIPQNTGNIGRLCAANNCKLDIIGDLGFQINDTQLKRAGLDYWEYLEWEYHENKNTYLQKLDKTKVHLLTTKSNIPYTSHTFKEGDILLFGNETTGIQTKDMTLFKNQWCTIPMPNPNIRSLNLSNSVSIVLYEALRQQTVSQTQTNPTVQ